jgi:hypothetical protein
MATLYWQSHNSVFSQTIFTALCVCACCWKYTVMFDCYNMLHSWLFLFISFPQLFQ